jgi:integrase
MSLKWSESSLALTYFERAYVPEQMFDCNADSVAHTRRAIRRLSSFAERSVTLGDLADDHLIASFLAWLRDTDIAATTVNGYRATIVAVANHAYNARLIDRPLRVRKVRTVTNPPLAWTAGEFRQIMAAARMFRQGWTYGTVHGGRIRCDWFWEALLSVAFETALRRGTLLAIRQTDVDLTTGWLTVDGSTCKTLKGQSYRLSADTIAALKRIWKPARKYVFAYATLREINSHFGKILKASGVPLSNRRAFNKFHQIRRTAATLIAAHPQGGITAAQNLLGHTSGEVTRRSYIDPTQLKHDVTEILPRLHVG